ncbi:MAG: hypothetical protein J6C26_01795 [Clostridia bacterium]|nr:hypothetical protein [Clostridia bacterium]
MRHLRKRALALCLCFVFGIFLTSCGDSSVQPPTGNTDTSVEAGTSASTVSQSSSESETEDPVADLVMAHNTITGVFGVYDMALLEPGDFLEEGLVWSCKTGEGGDMKYREGTVFGDVIVTCGSGIGKMISYPEGKVLWETKNPGNNPHAIEILPSGNIVIACSTGNILRLFKTSALLQGESATAISFLDVELRDAHGVLYDPSYEVVWALGGSELAAFSIQGDGTEQTLSRVGGMGVTLPSKYAGGHDLSADFTSKEHLYLTTNAKVFRFDKENNELIERFPQYAKLSKSAVKGFSNNPNGNFFYSRVNKGIGTSWEKETFAAWCTDRICFCYMKTKNLMYVQEYVSRNGAFYKIRAFCGSYQ